MVSGSILRNREIRKEQLEEGRRLEVDMLWVRCAWKV